jgi:hypothetical protein
MLEDFQYHIVDEFRTVNSHKGVKIAVEQNTISNQFAIFWLNFTLHVTVLNIVTIDILSIE